MVSVVKEEKQTDVVMLQEWGFEVAPHFLQPVSLTTPRSASFSRTGFASAPILAGMCVASYCLKALVTSTNVRLSDCQTERPYGGPVQLAGDGLEEIRAHEPG